MKEADDLGRLGHDKDKEALMASYIGGLRHELRYHFRGTSLIRMEEVLGHARRIEKDLGLAEEPYEQLEEPLEGSAEKSILVLDSSEEKEAYEAFWNYDDLADGNVKF